MSENKEYDCRNKEMVRVLRGFLMNEPETHIEDPLIKNSLSVKTHKDLSSSQVKCKEISTCDFKILKKSNQLFYNVRYKCK